MPLAPHCNVIDLRQYSLRRGGPVGVGIAPQAITLPALLQQRRSALPQVLHLPPTPRSLLS